LADDVIHILILTRKLLVDPEEFLAFVHHADETAEARVFGFEQGVEFNFDKYPEALRQLSLTPADEEWFESVR
jgi:hypothetical protein